MPTNLLLLPLLGGYWFIQNFHCTRFRARRLDGYRLLVESAFYGLLFTCNRLGCVKGNSSQSSRRGKLVGQRHATHSVSWNGLSGPYVRRLFSLRA